jgi:hypothetical protein
VGRMQTFNTLKLIIYIEKLQFEGIKFTMKIHKKVSPDVSADIYIYIYLYIERERERERERSALNPA